MRAGVLGVGGLPTHPRPARTEAHDPPAATHLQADHPRLRLQESTQQALSRHRTQPPEGLARAMDLRRPLRRAADQQPRRARSPRRRHLPKALPGKPIRGWRATHRAAALSLDHLPPTTPLTIRLPHRLARHPPPRRPNTIPRLTANGLNGYRFSAAPSPLSLARAFP